MFNKIYSNIKNFIKENYKTLLIMIICYLVLTFPLPYYIYTSGGTININDRINIENSYSSSGSFNFAYVSELRATPPTYLLSYIIKDWKLEKKGEYTLSKNETMDDVLVRDKLSLKEANDTAILLAYQHANKEIDIKGNHHYVTYIMDEANTDLKIGDEIVLIDDKKINTIDDYRDIISSKNVGDSISLTVLNNGKSKEKKIEIGLINNQKMTGISLITLAEYETDPNIKLNFHNNESGPSGGLMLTLAIYNKLIEEDITKGYKIVGTGTINKDGTVGEIGGVLYKLKGAVKDNADYFLVPSGNNYIDVVKEKKEKGYDIEIVEVKDLTSAITFLENLNKK